MSAITLQLPDELAERLRGHEEHLPQILELGLRELAAEAQVGFEGATEVLEFLAGLPSPQETLAFRPSERLQGQVQELLQKSRMGELSAEDERAWERYGFLEHLVRIAKAKARLKLNAESTDNV